MLRANLKLCSGLVVAKGTFHMFSKVANLTGFFAFYLVNSL